jgi:hypothetical protein
MTIVLITIRRSLLILPVGVRSLMLDSDFARLFSDSLVSVLTTLPSVTRFSSAELAIPRPLPSSPWQQLLDLFQLLFLID